MLRSEVNLNKNTSTLSKVFLSQTIKTIFLLSKNPTKYHLENYKNDYYEIGKSKIPSK